MRTLVAASAGLPPASVSFAGAHGKEAFVRSTRSACAFAGGWLLCAWLAGALSAAAAQESPDPVYGSGFEPCETTGIPTADAGDDRVSGLGQEVVLDGRRSCSPRREPLTFHWFLAEKPDGSVVAIDDATAATARLRPDLHGRYGVRLIVDDGTSASEPDEAAVRAFRNFGVDSDEDELSDALERSLGLDPYEADSFGDGVRDGNRDLDADGLSILQELLLATDPINPDSDGDGINDGSEDFDRDGLNNVDEFALGTGPMLRDSDGDGWIDGYERDGGGNPLDPAVVPRLFVASAPVASHEVKLPLTAHASGLPYNTIAATPIAPHEAKLPLTGHASGLPFNTIVATPIAPHEVKLPLTGHASGLPFNTIGAEPPSGHSVTRPSAEKRKPPAKE